MKRIIVFTVLSIMLLVSVVFAADATAPLFGDVLSTFLNQTIFPILGALVLGFVSWAAQKVGAKYKIDALTQQNNFVTNLAAQGVAFAEEKAANYAKTASPISGNDKLNAAIAYVMQMAPKVTPEQAQSLVTSTLAMLPGVGASGTAAVGTAPVVQPVVIPPIVPAAPAAPVDPLAVAP